MTTKPRKRATITVKRQYTGGLDIERAFTDIFTRALYKIPMQTATTVSLPPTPRTTPTAQIPTLAKTP